MTQPYHDRLAKQLFGFEVDGALAGKVNPETKTLIRDALFDTFIQTKTELGVSIPIVMRSSDLIVDSELIRDPNEKGTLAFFNPKSGIEKATSGELVIMRHTLVVYSSELEQLNRHSGHTPWKLVADVAHEIKHAQQDQENMELVNHICNAEPYNARSTEYESRLYAYEYLKKQKPKSISDGISKFIVMSDIRQELKAIKNNRRKLGLD